MGGARQPLDTGSSRLTHYGLPKSIWATTSGLVKRYCGPLATLLCAAGASQMTLRSRDVSSKGAPSGTR
jgi:hypothetical protein